MCGSGARGLNSPEDSWESSAGDPELQGPRRVRRVHRRHHWVPETRGRVKHSTQVCQGRLPPAPGCARLRGVALSAKKEVSDAAFQRLYGGLQDWYADDMRARAFDASSGPASGQAGHRILRQGRYQGPPWQRLWDEARAKGNLVAQAAILHALDGEIYGLSHGPSLSGPASGLHRGTREFDLAVASADGSLRAVARRFGVSHTEVRRLRFQYPEARGETASPRRATAGRGSRGG